MAVLLSDLARLKGAEKEKVLKDLMSTRTNGESLKPVRQEIRQYEHTYEMSTADLREGLASGRIEETAAIAEWLFLARLLKAHGG